MKKVDRATEYAESIVAGKKICGRKEFLACKRHLADMKRKRFDYKFDVDKSERAIDILNSLVLAEGESPKPLKTYGFQDFIVGSLAGWEFKKSGARRFREGYIQVARQNGKSLLAGGECNQFATFGGYELGKIYCAATKQEQANIVWNEVKKFIQADSDLEKLYKVTDHKNVIKSLITGTEIKSIGRDTKSADGFRSILAIIDEYHAHKNNQMYKLLLDGQSDVMNALTLAITTAGFDLNSACYAQYQLCEKILEGIIEKDSLFIYIAELDEDDDVFDSRNWLKANPYRLWNVDGSVNEDKVRIVAEKAIDAREKGGEDLLNFLTKDLNRWVAYSGEKFVDLEKFKKCESSLTLGDMRGRECYLGIDLSSGGDLTSMALLFKLESDKYYVYTHSFMPELRLLEHEKSDDVPYRLWAKQGLLTLTSGVCGVKTDYKFIINHLKELVAEYDLRVKLCGYDNHNASAFLADLDFLGCDLIEVSQSAKNLNDAVVDIQLSVKALQLQYNNNEALFKWSVGNAITTKNSFGELKIDKQKYSNRVDVVDAVIDAWKVMMTDGANSVVNANESFDEWEEMLKQRNKGKERR